MSDETLFSREALRWFACPVCHGALTCETDKVLCLGCGRRYLIEDGIPVLLRERALPPGEGQRSGVAFVE